MKKTLGVLSLMVMVLTQIVTPYAYAVGDESPIEEVVTDEVLVEEPMVLEPIEDEEIIEEDTSTEPENTVEEEIVIGNEEETNTDSGSNTELLEEQLGGGTSCENKEIVTGGEENLKEESEELSGAESSSGFFETVKEGVKNLLGIGGTNEDEEIIESVEIYGTGEYEGVKVEVYAQTGLFESGTILTIEPVIEEKLEQVKEVLSGEVEMVEEEEEQTVIAFDITFRDPETQEEIQPKNGTVQVTFNYEENENLLQAEEKEEQEVKVYHLNDIDEEGNKIEELTGTIVEEVVVNEEESEEENVIVVEAESFSIYAIIKGATNVGDTITVTYNANGGKFKAGNNQLVDEILVTYTKQSNGNYIPNINLQAPNRSNYMFAGRYTTSSNQSIERYGQVDDTTENSKKVYAKWLSFNDSTFTVSGVSFTMMDRNLGATSTNGGNKESYGYYYQWGNNFGFKYNKAYSSDRNRVSNSNHAVSPWGPGNYYSNSIFIDKGSRNSNWDEENNGNLRGGIKTMNPDSDRQGPCPEGYHVPDRYERDYMLKLFFSQKNSNANYCGSWKAGECLFYKFNLPWAGYRYDPSSTDVVSEYSFKYWSSTPAPGDDKANKAYYFDMYRSSSSENVISSFGRGNANPIRCFKDSKIEDTHKLIFSGDNGENEIIYNMRWREPITEEYRPENPTNGDLGFLGWYPYDNGQYGNLLHFNKEVRINKDTIIKARWGETNPTYTYDANGGYFENGENEVDVGHQIDEGYYERIENLQIPNKTGYMFVGWYTTSGDQTEEWIGQVDCEVQNTKRIYAKWLPFNDLTITMSGVTFTIMDRNLGAEEPAEGKYVNSNNDPIEDSKNLGFYYQWGNNYGFKNNLDFPKISNEIKDTLNNGPGNYYYSNIFISPTGGYSRSSNFNKNLWGGEKILNSDEDKQGPCPKGYHIPDKLEWKMVSSLYEGGNTISEYCNGSYNGCLNRILKLPFMGQVSYSDMQVPYYFHSPYWSSSPSTNDDYAEVYWLSYAQGMAYGIPIRCFKNSKIEDTVPLIFSGDNGTDDIVYNMRWWEPVTKLYIPDDPVKDGYGFIGWYIYEDGKCGEPFDFAAEKILTEPLILKAKWGRQGQKFEYNANGGLFKNGNEKIEIEHEIINGRYEEKEYIGIPSRTGYMFAGWFIESGDYTNQITERENGWTPMHDISKKIYAKWLPFNDLTVTMSGVTFTIMDRNLGASAYMNQGGKQSSEWNGYYYQWGNNYGFKNSGNMRYVDDIRVDADVYDGDLFYYKNIFKKINSSYYRRTINNNKNLWGGGRGDNGDIDRQGPCPGGYHVPNQKEWLNVIDLFKTQKNQDSDFCEDFSYESDCFASKLKLPYAGYRDYLGRVSNGGSYRSSTATTNEDQSFYIYIGQSTSISDQRYNSYYRAQAYPIRCFKDSPKIVYHSNGGTIPRRPTNVLRNGDNKLKLSNSIRTGYTFEGWYKTIDLIEGTEVYDNNIPTNDDYVDVYAKWNKTPRYTYNANGGSFSGINAITIKSKFIQPEKYSHTPNVDDEGNKLDDYVDRLQLNEVITITGAESLYISVTYGGENCCDWVTIWTGAHPDYTAEYDYNSSNKQKSIIGGNGYLYGGNHNDPNNTKEYYVLGDTVTFAYKSDSSSHGDDGYGYYAVIRGVGVAENYEFQSNENIANPERIGYQFLGWYETGALNAFDFTGTKVTKDRTLYAKWTPNTYIINFDINGGTGNVNNIDAVYGKKIMLPIVTKAGYDFVGWETEDGIIFNDFIPEGKGATTENGAIITLTAIWQLIPPAAGGGQSIIPATKEQEHNAAEEKQEDKQESNQDKQQDETVKDESKTPENTNTSNQTNAQQSSSSSKENTVTVDPEIQSAYEWAYERDVTTIPSLDDAMPDGVVKRGHLAKMVVNYATNVLGREIPEKIPSECRWNDWRKDWESEEIKDYAVKSCALGLMGLDMPKFLPNMEVTRAQFGTIMSRLLWGKKYAGGTPYYRKHLNALKENNIMTQIENPEKRIELRQWVWLMLMRSAENK